MTLPRTHGLETSPRDSQNIEANSRGQRALSSFCTNSIASVRHLRRRHPARARLSACPDAGFPRPTLPDIRLGRVSHTGATLGGAHVHMFIGQPSTPTCGKLLRSHLSGLSTEVFDLDVRGFTTAHLASRGRRRTTGQSASGVDRQPTRPRARSESAAYRASLRHG